MGVGQLELIEQLATFDDRLSFFPGQSFPFIDAGNQFIDVVLDAGDTCVDVCHDVPWFACR
ncbi:hypothetical protein D3C84_1291660 [compost metagenome]